MSEPEELGKLRWQCRRGVRELDVLMTRFLDESYSGLTDQERSAFRKLLEVQDPIIMGWIFGHDSCENKDLQGIVLKLANGVD